FEALETARLPREVVFKPVAPQIVLESVTPLPTETEEGTPLPVRPGEPVLAGVPRVRVRGSITALEDLTEATWDGKPLAGFKGKVKTFPIRQDVPLRAGLQKITFRARTGNREAAKALEVEYRPPLPTLAFLNRGTELVLY